MLLKLDLQFLIVFLEKQILTDLLIHQKESETVTESDSQGGQRTTTRSSSAQAALYEGQDKNTGNPYVSKEITPKVEGVVVIASGGDDALVVKNITEAVQALFGIDTHKIRIMKKN